MEADRALGQVHILPLRAVLLTLPHAYPEGDVEFADPTLDKGPLILGKVTFGLNPPEQGLPQFRFLLGRQEWNYSIFYPALLYIPNWVACDIIAKEAM
jgi:hypothetical protein